MKKALTCLLFSFCLQMAEAQTTNAEMEKLIKQAWALKAMLTTGDFFKRILLNAQSERTEWLITQDHVNKIAELFKPIKEQWEKQVLKILTLTGFSIN
jgi:hypothetical protein